MKEEPKNNEPIKKLRKDIKVLKEAFKAEHAAQSLKLKNLRDLVRSHLAYKQLILTSAKSNHKPESVVGGLKFAAKQIKAKNWPMVDRVSGSSGDLEARGACPVCRINLTGKNLKPREITFPCGILNCPFEKK